MRSLILCSVMPAFNHDKRWTEVYEIFYSGEILFYGLVVDVQDGRNLVNGSAVLLVLHCRCLRSALVEDT
jgi:hypothetical protein